MYKYIIISKNIFNKIKDSLEKNQIASFLLVFSFFFFAFTLVYMKINVLSSGDDHYFHFRFAEKLLNEGFFNSFNNFKSIYFTNIAEGQHFIYYNFLFYLFILPFTLITPLFLAIKLYAIIIVSLIGSIIYLFMKKMSIKYPFLWSIGFFAIIGLTSIFRLFLSRPYVFAPVFILLLILAINKKNYIWVFVLSFLYLFWHTATFFVPLLIGFLFFIFYFLYEKKYNWKLLLAIISGFILSILTVLLIDSGFFYFFYDNVLDLIKGIILGNHVNIPEGAELYPKNFFDFLNQNLLLFIMYIIACVSQVAIFLHERSLELNKEIKDKRILSMTLFIVSSVFFVCISVVSNRFADFFVFFAWIFIIIMFNEIINNLKFNNPAIMKSVQYGIIICIFYLVVNNCLQLNDTFASYGSRPDEFAEVGNYLSKNLAEGDIVYNVTWNWFPQLFYYAPKQNYIIGLEPKLTYVYNQKLYWLWSNISLGYVCDQEKCEDSYNQLIRVANKKDKPDFWYKDQGDKIADIVVNEFKSHYIVSSSGYPLLNNILDNNKNFKKVLNSYNNYFVYKILD